MLLKLFDFLILLVLLLLFSPPSFRFRKSLILLIVYSPKRRQTCVHLGLAANAAVEPLSAGRGVRFARCPGLSRSAWQNSKCFLKLLLDSGQLHRNIAVSCVCDFGIIFGIMFLVQCGLRKIKKARPSSRLVTDLEDFRLSVH